MKLAYVKLSEAVCVDGAMTYELRDATASALGVVVASAGGSVLVPWHCVRWGVQAETERVTTITPGGLAINDEAVVKHPKRAKVSEVDSIMGKR